MLLNIQSTASFGVRNSLLGMVFVLLSLLASLNEMLTAGVTRERNAVILSPPALLAGSNLVMLDLERLVCMLYIHTSPHHTLTV